MTQDWKKLYRREEEADDALAYTDTAIDHFLHPRNVGRVEDYDGYGKVGDPECGDYLELTLKLGGPDVITDIGFLVQGCAGAISTSSMVTELVLGKTAKAALALCDDDVVRALGGLPESKRHCSLLGVRALHLAIADALACRRLIDEGRVKDKPEYRRLRESGAVRIGFEEGERERS